MTERVVLLAGSDPTDRSADPHSADVRAHASALTRAGFEVLLLCCGDGPSRNPRPTEPSIGSRWALRRAGRS